MNQWKNVPGELLTDVSLVLPFRSTGWFDPAQTCGPPESDDVRLPDGPAYLDFGKAGRVKLTQEQTEQLANFLVTELYDVELENEK